jgi:hypothetical protein
MTENYTALIVIMFDCFLCRISVVRGSNRLLEDYIVFILHKIIVSDSVPT